MYDRLCYVYVPCTYYLWGCFYVPIVNACLWRASGLWTHQNWQWHLAFCSGQTQIWPGPNPFCQAWLVDGEDMHVAGGSLSV